MTDREDDYQVSIDKQNFLKLAAVFAILLGTILLLIAWYSTSSGWGEREVVNDEIQATWDFKAKIGDYIGGIVGTLFSLAGFFLLYLTFQKQRESFERERFESKFFDLLRIHRDNVTEFNIADRVHGRKCFVQMLNEFNHIYLNVSQASEVYKNDSKSAFDNEESVVDFSFKIFFFGIGYNSEIQLFHFITNEQRLFYLEVIKDRLVAIQSEYLKFRKINKEDYFQWLKPLATENDQWTFEIDYMPFDGHSIRLGHYYRHLFQTVKFVDKRKSLLSFKERYFYLKTLRAQLSNQEQLLLYCDSLSEFGRSWHTKGYFKVYSFLKNLPLPLVVVKPHPHHKIGKYTSDGKFIFEWDDVQAHRLRNDII